MRQYIPVQYIRLVHHHLLGACEHMSVPLLLLLLLLLVLLLLLLLPQLLPPSYLDDSVEAEGAPLERVQTAAAHTSPWSDWGRQGLHQSTAAHPAVTTAQAPHPRQRCLRRLPQSVLTSCWLRTRLRLRWQLQPLLVVEAHAARVQPERAQQHRWGCHHHRCQQ